MFQAAQTALQKMKNNLSPFPATTTTTTAITQTNPKDETEQSPSRCDMDILSGFLFTDTKAICATTPRPLSSVLLGSVWVFLICLLGKGSLTCGRSRQAASSGSSLSYLFISVVLEEDSGMP